MEYLGHKSPKSPRTGGSATIRHPFRSNN